MSDTPTDHNQLLHELEVDVEAGLAMAEASHPEEAFGVPAAEWLFDPTDVESEEIGLRSLHGAVEALEGDNRRNTSPDVD
jgi:hypothetical protein